MRKVLAALAALFITALVAAPAWADAGSYQQAAAGLAAEPVYVAPNSGADISRGEVNKLDSQIKKYGIPLYIAILPQSAIADAGGNVDDTPKALGTALGRTAVYGVVAGHNFRATSNGALPSGRTADIANSSFDNNSPADNDGRIYPLLSDFAKNVYYAFHPEAKPKTNWGLIWTVIGSIAGGLVACALAAWALVTSARRRREERERQARFDARKAKAEAWYSRVLDKVSSTRGYADSAVQEHSMAAADALQRGDTLVGTAKTEDDLANAENEFLTAEKEADAAKTYIDKRRGVDTFIKRTKKRVDALPECDGKADACKQAAITQIRDAELMLDNDVSEAQSMAEYADAQAADCEVYCAGRDPVQEREDAERERQRLAAEAAERRRREDEQRAAEEKRRQELAARVKPSNFKPVKSRSATHEHRFGGGYYSGVYYAPGYYTDPFWTWVAMDAALSSSRTFEHGSSYDDNYRELHPPSYSSSSSSSSSSSYSGFDSSSGGGSWDGGSSGGGGFDSSSGGGSW